MSSRNFCKNWFENKKISEIFRIGNKRVFEYDKNNE